MALDQNTRLLRLITPLGGDKLLLTSLRGHEELSRLFDFQLEMISDDNSITAADIVGQGISFQIEMADGEPRYFHGFVNRFVAGDEQHGRRNYRAEVVPWLWFLTQTADCRIFQNKSVPQIITQIFEELGFDDFETAEVQGNHKAWDYCVQYRETDFNFVSRLMEQEGIFYYFRHESDKHVLVLADQPGAYRDCIENEVDYPSDVGSAAMVDHLTSWEHRWSFHTGKWSQTDYNFESPRTDLMANVSSVVKLPTIEKYEVYDYPGEYKDRDTGREEAQFRMEEEEVQHDVVHASSTCKSFSPGGMFTVTQHRSSTEVGRQFVIASIQHMATEPMAYETGSVSNGVDYVNSFTCLPHAVTFRPARRTPKPLVSGCQTAVVVGPKGEEIHTDQFGRVKVQFHWDREGKRNEDSSCWMRVAQNVAGKRWGFMAIPRIGQEVVVEFLEGDPDCPLIVGSVYNAEQMPHYELPSERTKSYFKSNSSTGGEGFNELMFEDQKGAERVFIHAERDMDTRVKNDSKSRIFGHRHQIIGWEKDGQKSGDQRERVYQDKHLNVKRHQLEHIEGNYRLMVGNGEADSGGNLDLVVENKKTELVEGDSDLIVNGDQKNQIDGSLSLNVGGDQHNKVAGNIATEAGSSGEIHLKAGMKIIIEAGSQISIKGPGGFIDIGPAGVTIQGAMVKINSGGSAGSGRGCSPQQPAEAERAQPTQPSLAHDGTSGMKSAPE